MINLYAVSFCLQGTIFVGLFFYHVSGIIIYLWIDILFIYELIFGR